MVRRYSKRGIVYTVGSTVVKIRILSIIVEEFQRITSDMSMFTLAEQGNVMEQRNVKISYLYL